MLVKWVVENGLYERSDKEWFLLWLTGKYQHGIESQISYQDEKGIEQ